MLKIQCLNKIAEAGLAQLPSDRYQLADQTAEADAILVRSADLKELVFPANLKAIARAGAGTNNIPISRCSEAGIVVFNTPGANANAVKELVLGALVLSCRPVIPAVNWIASLGIDPHNSPLQIEVSFMKLKSHTGRYWFRRNRHSNRQSGSGFGDAGHRL